MKKHTYTRLWKMGTKIILILLALLFCFSGCVRKSDKNEPGTAWPEDKPLPTSFDDFSGFDELDLTKSDEEVLADARALGYVVFVESKVDEASQARWKQFMETAQQGKNTRVKTLEYYKNAEGKYGWSIKEIVYTNALYYVGGLDQSTGQVKFRTVKRYLAGGIVRQRLGTQEGSSDCGCTMEQYVLTDLIDFNLEEYWTFFAHSTTVETEREEKYLYSYIVYFVQENICPNHK